MYDNNNYNNFNGTSGGEPPVNNQNENKVLMTIRTTITTKVLTRIIV